MRPSVRVAVLATIASMSFSSIARAELACWHPNEARAAQIKDFQTLLMVGTLQCRTADATAVDDYNIFVRHNRSMIDSNIYALKAHFLRESGIQEGQRAYDEYVTALANDKASQLGDPSFCGTVETLAGLAATASATDLMTLAQSVSLAPESGNCAPAGEAPAATVQPAVVATKVEAAADPHPYPPEQAAAAVVPAIVPATTAAPAKPTRDEAMASAVAALQAAATALQAASAGGGDVAPGVPEPAVKSVALSKDEEDQSGAN